MKLTPEIAKSIAKDRRVRKQIINQFIDQLFQYFGSGTVETNPFGHGKLTSKSIPGEVFEFSASVETLKFSNPTPFCSNPSTLALRGYYIKTDRGLVLDHIRVFALDGGIHDTDKDIDHLLTFSEFQKGCDKSVIKAVDRILFRDGMFSQPTLNRMGLTRDELHWYWDGRWESLITFAYRALLEKKAARTPKSETPRRYM